MEFKNLKVPESTHEKLVSRANALGMKKFVIADALLLAGLGLTDQEIQEAVVNAQRGIMPPTANTTQAIPKPKR